MRARMPRHPAALQRTCFPSLSPSGGDVPAVAGPVAGTSKRSHAAPSHVHDRCDGEPQSSPHVPRLPFVSVPAAAAWIGAPITKRNTSTLLPHATSLSPAAALESWTKFL